jgi:hypothetical protein
VALSAPALAAVMAVPASREGAAPLTPEVPVAAVLTLEVQVEAAGREYAQVRAAISWAGCPVRLP